MWWWWWGVLLVGCVGLKQEDPKYFNPGCPCFDRRAIRLLFVPDLPASSYALRVMLAGMKEAASDLDVELDARPLQAFSTAGMETNIIEGTKRNISGLITSMPTFAAGGAPYGSIRQVLNQGVPVVTVHSGDTFAFDGPNMRDRLVHIGPDNYRAGVMAAEFLLSNGVPITNALCVNTLESNSAAELRCQGFADTLLVQNVSTHIVVVNPFVIDFATTLIASHLEEDNAIFITSAEGVSSTLAAVEQHGGPRPTIVAFDLSPEVAAGLQSGLLAAAIDQQPYLAGYLSVLSLVNALVAESLFVDRFLYTGPVLTLPNSTFPGGGVVEHAARESMGFVQPVGQRNFTVFVATHARSSSTFFAGMRSAFLRASRDMRVKVIDSVSPSSSINIQAQFLNATLLELSGRSRNAGLIFSLPGDGLDDIAQQLLHLPHLSAVVVNVGLPSPTLANLSHLPSLLGYVGQEEYQAGYLASQRLLQATNFTLNKSMCLSPDPTKSPYPQRCDGFAAGMAEANVTCLTLVVNIDSQDAFKDQLVDHFMDGYTAVLATGTSQIPGLSAAVTKWQTMNASSIKVCTFDSMPSLWQLDGLLTAIDQQVDQQGYLSVALLVLHFLTDGNRLIPSPSSPSPGLFVLQTGPILRSQRSELLELCDVAMPAPLSTGDSSVQMGIEEFPFASISHPLCIYVESQGAVAGRKWLSPAAEGVLIFLVVAAATLQVVFLACTIILRRSRVFITSSLTFLRVFLCGTLVITVAAALSVASPSPAVCSARVVLFHLGFAISYAALCLKLWVVHRIFHSRKVSYKPLSKPGLFAVFASVLVVDAVYIAIWQAIRPNVHVESLVDGDSCETTSVEFFGVACGLIGLLILFGAYLTFQNRTVPSLYRESEFLAGSVYNTTVMVCVWLFLRIGFDFVLDGKQKAVIDVALLLETVVWSCLSLFIPKFLAMNGKLTETIGKISNSSTALGIERDSVVKSSSTTSMASIVREELRPLVEIYVEALRMEESLKKGYIKAEKAQQEHQKASDDIKTLQYTLLNKLADAEILGKDFTLEDRQVANQEAHAVEHLVADLEDAVSTVANSYTTASAAKKRRRVN